MRAQSSSSRAVTSAPASTSLWPFRYLVAECMTRSAPSSSGRVSSGVGTVLSTATTAPAAWARPLSASMSLTAQVGFAGVSSQSRRVRPGRSAAWTAAGSVVSTKSTSRPQAVAVLSSQ